MQNAMPVSEETGRKADKIDTRDVRTTPRPTFKSPVTFIVKTVVHMVRSTRLRDCGHATKEGCI